MKCDLDDIDKYKDYTVYSPVLFLVFNRPDTTTRVFDAIRRVRPTRLYVAADGARTSRIGEDELVAETRKIATAVDWPCEIKTLFRDRNLGCKQAVSEALNWFFSKEEKGIILEDDCLPHPDFFRYCDTLLDRYASNTKISVITGNNFQHGQARGECSYYFSKYNHCWGWATWRRVWQFYSGDLPFFTQWQKTNQWIELNPDPIERRYWESIFKKVQRNEIDSWAYPWTASVWRWGGLTVTPNVNLVTNIGFGDGATHTNSKFKKSKEVAVESLGLIIHNDIIEQNVQADAYVFDQHFGGKYMRWPWLPIYKLVKHVQNAMKFAKRRLS